MKTIKESKLRQIISEEIRNILKEDINTNIRNKFLDKIKDGKKQEQAITEVSKELKIDEDEILYILRKYGDISKTQNYESIDLKSLLRTEIKKALKENKNSINESKILSSKDYYNDLLKMKEMINKTYKVLQRRK